MKLIGFDDHGTPTMGVVIGDAVAALAPISDFYADLPGWTAKARQIQQGDRPLTSVTQVPPVPGTAKVLCVALNYVKHAEEANLELPQYPNIFPRWTATLVADGVSIPVPVAEPGLDWEVELAAIVGTQLTDVDAETAVAGVFGYTAFNDVSARVHQLATGQWALGKNPDFSGPVGPIVVTADELGDPGNLHLEARVNGEVMQSSSTADMVFSVGEILAYASRTITLRPGDLIATGTPEGVGWPREPRILLQPGDVVEVEVEGIGTIRNPIVDASGRG